MSCAACSARVESAVSRLAGVTSCSVNLLTNSMNVEGELDDGVIIEAVEKAGYGAKIKGEATNKNTNKSLQASDEKTIKIRLISSLVLLAPLMYISMGYVMFSAPVPRFLAENPLNTALLQCVLSAIIMMINQKFFINGARGIINRSPNMDTLVSIGSAASFLYSLVVIFIMNSEAANGYDTTHYLHGLYFESAAMILTLITVGKMLEARAKGKTTDAINSLVKLSPRLATVRRGGKEIIITADELEVGDIFIVKPGEAIPADGRVVFGESSVVEAALTGESIPSDKAVGDKVLCATLNTSGYLECEATEVGAATAISKVIKMVEDATATKAPIAKTADRVSGIFVPAVMAIAAVTLFLWWIFGGDFGHALARAVSVLVISCPCALGLATPVAIMVGSGVGAKRGILFKTAESLELSGRAKTVILDKTGTITEGSPKVTDVIALGEFSKDELLRVALAVEQSSEHPLADAITAYADSRVTRECVSDFRALSGSGVFARLSGEEIYGGSFDFISGLSETSDEAKGYYERLSGEGKTPMLFTRSGKLVGIIAVADTVREDSRLAINEMKKMGMRVVMLTGDNSRTANAIGKISGVTDVISGVLPDGKARAVEELKREGRVIMVVDGINDAPALTAADVGMAIGGGTDIAIESADVVLMRSSLLDVTTAIKLSSRTLKNIYENLFWAFIYNLIGIPLAAGVFGLTLNPMFGAAAMSISSFTVVMNALRLNTFKVNYKEENINVESEKKDMKLTMKIKGMMCPHCEARVKKALESLKEVVSAEVSHKKGEAIVTLSAECADKVLTDAVTAQGYEVISVGK